MPLDKTISHTQYQSPEALLGRHGNHSAQKNETSGRTKWLNKITPSGIKNFLQSRASATVRDTRHHGASSLQTGGTNFDRPVDASDLTTSIENIPVAETRSQSKYDNLSAQLETIYANWNVDDYINVDDVSSVINALNHNQDNELFDHEINGINILYSKLLIEDAINTGANKDFVKSLELSILYTDLKKNKDEAGIQNLLQHIAKAKHQNLFIIETLSSGERRSNLGHATGRVITRHPTGSWGKPLVAVNVNKGYRSDKDRGRYTYRFLKEKPSMRKLRYPKWDAHKARSRLDGNGQTVGNCSVIAYKEALQVAKAFQDADFKKGFFEPLGNTDPAASAGSKELKDIFKTLYGFGEDNTIRVQDKLSSLLLKKLEEKASDPLSIIDSKDIKRVSGLTKIRFAQKRDREAIIDGKTQNSTFRTISPDIIQDVGLDQNKLHLADVKTVITSGQGVSNYLGLSDANLIDATEVIKALNELWQMDAGTIDEKANLTKQLIKSSILAASNYDLKIDLINSFISLNNFQASSTENTDKAKRDVQNIAIDALQEYHSPGNQEELLQDPRIKNIVSALLKSGNATGSQALLSTLVFPEVEGFKDSSESPKTINERNIKAFITKLLNDTNFVSDLRHVLAKQSDNVSLINWISLIDKFITIKSDEFRDPAQGQSGPTAAQQKRALKADWAPAVLRAAEHKLKSDKIRDHEDAIDAMGIAISIFGASQNDVRDNSALSAIFKRTLAQKSGEAFINALHLASYYNSAQTAIEQADPIPLADKLLAEFHKGQDWEKSQTAHALCLLAPSGKAHFINGLLEKPNDFHTARPDEKNYIIYAITQLLSANNFDAEKPVTDFIKVFSNDLKKDFAEQVQLLENGDKELSLTYLYNLTNLIELSQASNSPLGADVKSIIQLDDDQTQGLTKAITQVSNQRTGESLAVAASLARISQTAKDAIKSSDQQQLGDNLQKSFVEGSTWTQEHTTFALGLLNNDGKASFISGLNNKPQALQNARHDEKKDIIETANNLLSTNSQYNVQTATLFANTFKEDLKTELSQQVNYRATEDNSYNEDYVKNLFNILPKAEIVALANSLSDTTTVGPATFKAFSELLTQHALNHSDATHKSDVFAALIDVSHQLLNYGDPNNISVAIERLAHLSLDPINIDITTLGTLNKEALINTLLNIFSNPSTHDDTRHNTTLILRDSKISDQARLAAYQHADSKFVDAISTLANREGSLNDAYLALDLADLLLPTHNPNDPAFQRFNDTKFGQSASLKTQLANAIADQSYKLLASNAPEDRNNGAFRLVNLLLTPISARLRQPYTTHKKLTLALKKFLSDPAIHPSLKQSVRLALNSPSFSLHGTPSFTEAIDEIIAGQPLTANSSTPSFIESIDEIIAAKGFNSKQ